MTFREFWPLYLKAHRLPGTRALHYFATIIGISASIDAIATRHPLIFVIGVSLSYSVAICSHLFIEGNQPLIRVNAVWGAMADLHMFWLALIGRLDAELARHVTGADLATAEPYSQLLRRPAWRYALILASAAGLVTVLADLRDLFDPIAAPPYLSIQLGMPIAAFTGALIAARSTQSEASLQRACLALLAFGTVAFGLAELVEHGNLQAPHVIEAAAAHLASRLSSL